MGFLLLPLLLHSPLRRLQRQQQGEENASVVIVKEREKQQ